jgi:hypothetical protein
MGALQPYTRNLRYCLNHDFKRRERFTRKDFIEALKERGWYNPHDEDILPIPESDTAEYIRVDSFLGEAKKYKYLGRPKKAAKGRGIREFSSTGKGLVVWIKQKNYRNLNTKFMSKAKYLLNIKKHSQPVKVHKKPHLPTGRSLDKRLAEAKRKVHELQDLQANIETYEADLFGTIKTMEADVRARVFSVHLKRNETTGMLASVKFIFEEV